MNILAIDYGDTRVGLAHSYSGLDIALPLRMIMNDKKFFYNLISVIEELEIELILVGLPLNLQSIDTIQTKKVRNFVENLKTKFDGRIELLDERMTSALAKKYLAKKSSIDVESARIILEDWLSNNI